ncbi:MAG TPA: ribonuclease H-like domain-containing protein [Luteitalea sp.]|nr:ribonuclease H-like domain-containing protein [Luteitalea sp.]
MASTLNRLRDIARGTPGSASANATAGQAEPTGKRELTYVPVDANGLPADPRDHFVDGVVEAVEGARIVETAHGACMVIEHRFEGHRSHGRVRVEQCGEIALDETLDVLAGRALRGDRVDGAPPPRRLVYFDLETTGLSGGAGMVAFLAGVGEWRDDAFVTTQFLMPSFTTEPALLHALNDYFGDDAVLVTYNGRTFDVPVMEMRGEMQRVPQVVCDLPHLDLLHAARRLWRASEAGDRSCRLTHLEESVLGVGRVGDVGGFEIPARYFQFVRGGGMAGLEPVLLHNRLDLLSLAALTAHAQRLVRDGREQAPSNATAFGLGALYERSGWIEAALPCYQAAADDHWQTRELRRSAARALARLLRRQRRYEEAAEAWQRLLQLGGRPQILREAREALAIHHEHRGGQLEEARRHAVAGVEQAIGRGERDDFSRRLARLERKLARVSAEMPLWNE